MDERLRIQFKWACGLIDEDISNVVRDLMRAATVYINAYCIEEKRWITPELRPIALRRRRGSSVGNRVTVGTNHGKLTVHNGKKIIKRGRTK